MVRPISSAGVVLALVLSTFFVMVSLGAFTMLCWRVGADLGELPEMPLLSGLFSKRLFWLLIAALALLFARLIDAFMMVGNSAPESNRIFSSADELPAGALDCLMAAPE